VAGAGGEGNETMEIDVELAARLRKLVRRSGMKQCVLAARCGIKPKKLANMLIGRKSIRGEYIRGLCKVLRITPNELFGWDEE